MLSKSAVDDGKSADLMYLVLYGSVVFFKMKTSEACITRAVVN